MKLHLNVISGSNNINGHGDGYVLVNGERIEHAIIVLPDVVVDPWPLDEKSPAPENFDIVLAQNPELVVFGSGRTFRFPDPRVMALFAKAKVGFEVMDTAAACRTYNVLMSEGRRVAAALLV
jgi:uncharacterized protein